MSTNEFRNLELINPKYDSKLIDIIINLEKLRDRKLTGSTHPQIFFQLKEIFHILESIGSARIEGNHTTIAEYIETKINDGPIVDEGIREILNIEKSMAFIEENIVDNPINRAFISELHKMVVEGLSPPPNGEGDLTPGLYRTRNVGITGANHIPPDQILVSEYMDDLINFINTDHSQKYDLIKTALAHHRFVWIHPFTNGNGRTVRLLTYAMLVKQGFNVNVGRILNPTAIFCSNRDDYYAFLSGADSGEYDGIENWCIYVLMGLKEEIEKIDRLIDYQYLKAEILMPSLKLAHKREYITNIEFAILKRAVDLSVIQSSDIDDIVQSKNPSERSRQISNLITKKMLRVEKPSKRKYIIDFSNSNLFRTIMEILDEKGFLPIKDTPK